MEKAKRDIKGGHISPRAQGTGRGWGLDLQLLSPEFGGVGREGLIAARPWTSPSCLEKCFRVPHPHLRAWSPFLRVSEARLESVCGGAGTGQPSLAYRRWGVGEVGGWPGLGALGWANGSWTLDVGATSSSSPPSSQAGRKASTPLPKTRRSCPSF